MTVELLRERLQKVRETKEQLVGQLNALVGREAELAELIAELEKPPSISSAVEALIDKVDA